MQATADPCPRRSESGRARVRTHTLGVVVCIPASTVLRISPPNENTRHHTNSHARSLRLHFGQRTAEEGSRMDPSQGTADNEEPSDFGLAWG